jgi:hypothetical protein
MENPIQTPETNQSETMPEIPKIKVDGSQTRRNGMTDEQVRYALAAAGRRKDDPGYIQRGEEGIAEYRKNIQEEAERALTKTESK